MARKGLPKKYAKMGFKKGWAAYKRTKRAPTRRRRTTRSPARTRRRAYPMARRRRTYRRARTGGGKFKGAIDGVLGGAAATLAKRFAPQIPFVDDLALIGVGIFRKNQTLTTIGAMGLGSDLVSGFGGGAGAGGGYI